jgi:hypothetical protein
MPTISRVYPAVTVASPATSGYATSIVARGLSQYDLVTVRAALGSPNNAGTLDVALQRSFDGGTTWSEWCRFPQVGVSGAVSSFFVCPSLTGEIKCVSTTSGAITIDANTVVGGPVGDQLRCVMLASSATNVSAAQTFYVQCWTGVH